MLLLWTCKQRDVDVDVDVVRCYGDVSGEGGGDIGEEEGSLFRCELLLKLAN
jgi:hypothetical protein